jgi:hypothetical protein
MHIRLLSGLLAILSICVVNALAEEQQPPALRAFHRLAGKWSGKTNVSQPKESQSDVAWDATWVLGGKVLQIKSAGEFDYLTYDPQRQAFRYCIVAAGACVAGTATWDDNARTLTFNNDHDPADNVAIAATLHLIDDNSIETEIKGTNKEGKVVYHSTTRMNRVAEKE